MTTINTTEIHFNFYECNCSDTLFAKGEKLTRNLLAIVKSVELMPVGDCHYNFTNSGCTVSILLAESHLVVHLWPECAKTVVGDISVCNFSQNNYQKSLALLTELKKLFQPEKVSQWVFRGPGVQLGNRYTEVAEIIFEDSKQNTKIQVMATPEHQAIVLVDGKPVAAAKENEDIYEPIIHIPLWITSGQHVVIVDDLSGAGLNQLGCYSGIETLVSLFSSSGKERVFSQIFDNMWKTVPHCEKHVDKLNSFFSKTSSQWDVIIVSPLYFDFDALAAIHSGLSHDGIAVLPLAAQSENRDVFQKRFHEIKTLFPHAKIFSNYVSLLGDVFFWVIVSKKEINLPMHKKLMFAEELEFLSDTLVSRMFSLPAYLQRITKDL